jgi:tRNA pseudouridine65 synthase
VNAPAESVPRIEVLLQDEAIVVVAKPPGLLCHRSTESGDRVFLLQTLRNQLGRLVYPVHRLDRAASGAIAFALGSDEARLLQAALGAPESRKEYLVLVRGETPASWESKRPLKNDAGTVQDAHTVFEKVAGFSRLTLLRAAILTGRRHQIRRHLAHEAHQVLGDSTYGKGKINAFFREQYGLPRLFLHASSLEFLHPLTGAPTVVRCPLAEDLRAFLDRLPDVPPDLLDGRL